ncbi:helix-turn-helix domain-containing protein [Saccharopolyspora flava]|uniref:Helix-turn-helix domain-containing protein n=1 Tax=Saccharopolyspora flava TaxID=95161 RepID=A0A1I6RLC3_9PSEU|nr:helix-turn-helix transcriptional regulator [Saccharopolyspora flava]SFS65248.1 Helix-turn-helix domain-containing protein [Saccharopolyspora flava]
MSATVRTARKLLLGRELAHMIETAGLSQSEAAKLIETSQSRIALLINGGGSISPGDLVLLADKLGFDDEGYKESLRELRRDNHKRGFWTTGHNRAYSEDLRLLVDLEKHADQIRAAHVEVIPGLLQCEAYVRAQHEERSGAGDVSLDERVEARLARQEILAGSEAPIVQYVISESCVRRTWGDADVMREQMDFLIKLSKRPNIMLQVMPFDQPVGQRVPVVNPFTVIHVPSPGAAGSLKLVYVEGEGEIRYLDDKKAVAAHEAAWARVSNAALRFEETRKFLKSVSQDFRK